MLMTCLRSYVFNSKEEISLLVEDAETGPSVKWAKKEAIRLQCFVIVGYPQVVQESENSLYYNSLCCVNSRGEVVKTYQKSFLYEADERWAEEGPGFVSVVIPGLGKVGFGICMDINPYQFKADFRAYEFANYHVEQRTDIILCSMAWLQSESSAEISDTDRVLETIRYWAARMNPLKNSNSSSKHTYFVACNRVGTERGVTFAGGSCVLDFSDTAIRLKGHMLSRECGIMIVEVSR
ncbi:Carbon-nitrogen hydrolase [Apophysomyces sp. BC1021]|nr:Carbon-nitrogen hydrolase [Apophysomyces sp. BC1021]